MPDLSHFRLREPAIYSPQATLRQGKSPLFTSMQTPPRFQDTRTDVQWIGSMPGGSGMSFKDRLLQALSPLRSQ